MAALRFFFVVKILMLLFTKGLCDPYGLSVSDVTANSAVIHWQTSEIWADVFKVHCTGLIHDYTDPYMGIDEVVQYAPKGADHVMIGGMKANFMYSCIVIEELPEGEIKLSRPFLFSTEETDGLTQLNVPVSHVMYVAHLSIAAGLGMLAALFIIGCTLCIIAAIVIRDKNDLQKESRNLERLVIACSNPAIHYEQEQKHHRYGIVVPHAESHPVLGSTPQAIHCPGISKSDTSLVNNAAAYETSTYKAPVYYTAQSDSNHSNCDGDNGNMLNREPSNRFFCTPPDIDDGVVTGANKQEVLTTHLVSDAPRYDNTSRGYQHTQRSLSVFSSSSSDDGGIDGFLESDHIEVDISGIL